MGYTKAPTLMTINVMEKIQFTTNEIIFRLQYDIMWKKIAFIVILKYLWVNCLEWYTYIYTVIWFNKNALNKIIIQVF